MCSLVSITSVLLQRGAGGLFGDRVPGRACFPTAMGAGDRAVKPQPWCCRFSCCSVVWMQLASKAGLPLVLRVSKQERSHQAALQMREIRALQQRGVEGAKSASLSLTVLHTIGLQFLRQSPVALEAKLALIPSFLPSTSYTGSKVMAFFPSGVNVAVVHLLCVRANQGKICPAKSVLVKPSSRVNLLF